MRDRLRAWGRTSADPAALLLAFVLLGTLADVFALAEGMPGLDYYQFWAVGRAMDRGRSGEVYDAVGREALGRDLRALAEAEGGARQRAVAAARPVLQTFGTPLQYVLLRPLTSGPYEDAYRRFQAVSTVLGAGAVVLLSRLAGWTWAAGFAACLAVTAGFEPFGADVRMGNVNRLQLAGLALLVALLARRGRPGAPFAAGVVLALLVLAKPNLVYVAAVLLGVRALEEDRAASRGLLSGALAGGALALVLTVPWMRPGAWAAWVVSLAALPEGITPVASGNFALARLLSDGAGLSVAGPLTAVLLAVPLALAWRRARSAAAAADGPLLVGLGVLVYLLAAPLVWTHYLLLAVPPALYALRPEHGLPTQAAGLLAVALLALSPLRVASGAGPVAVAASTHVALLALYVAHLWLLARRS